MGRPPGGGVQKGLEEFRRVQKGSFSAKATKAAEPSGEGFRMV